MRNNCIACITVAGLVLGASCHQQRSRVSALEFHGPIDAAGSTSQSTILIVPTNEADKAVERKIHEYVQGMQKFIMERAPGRDVKVMTDAEALQADLSGSSLGVYGTPKGNLWLAKHIAALPVAIEPDGITADRLYKGSDLRFISAWPNPQNPQKGIVIYTAQRAEDIIGINAVMHGPTDYLVARGQTILRAADYVNKKGRWAFPPFQLDVAQAREDLDFFFKTVEQVHPNCRVNLSKAGYRSLKECSYAALKQAGDGTGQVPVLTLALTSAEAAAALGDGHTACDLSPDLADPGDPTPCMPPFQLRWDAGHVTIDKAIGGLEPLAGARLLQINGKPFEEAVARVLTCVSGERQEFRIICFLNNQEALWALIRPAPGEEMTVTIRRGKDEPRTIKVPLISQARYRQELPAVRQVYPTGSHEFHHDGRTCYWRYDSFNASDQGIKAIDAVFKDIREHNARNLIIDLRFNGGGSTGAADHILSYLTGKPYRDYSRVNIRLSPQLLEVQDLGMLGPFARLLQGHVVSRKLKYVKPADLGYKFEGSVYALVRPYTFSAASDFTHVLQDFRIGTLVGEETGGLRQCFGDCPSFRMPHSNLSFSVSTKRFYAPIPKPGDAAHGSPPDIPVTDENLAPFVNAQDPELAFTLDLIAKRSAPTIEGGSR